MCHMQQNALTVIGRGNNKMTDDYTQRAEQYGFATKEEVQQALKQPHAVVLDVRTEDEIAQEHFETDLKWVHSGCRPTTCPVLEKMPEKLLPDKDAPVIIYCKSGRRASKAAQILTGHGYKHVYNAGAISDLKELAKNVEHIVVKQGEHTE